MLRSLSLFVCYQNLVRALCKDKFYTEKKSLEECIIENKNVIILGINKSSNYVPHSDKTWLCSRVPGICTGLLLNKNASYKTAVLLYIRHRIPHKVGSLVTCIDLRIDKIQQPRLSVQEVVTVFLDDNSGFVLWNCGLWLGRRVEMNCFYTNGAVF
jgi:hypothetical protein